MKKTTRLMSLVMAIVLLISMAVTANAKDITITDAPAGAQYKAYQLLNLSAALKDPSCHAVESEHTASCYNLAYDLNPKYEDILKTVTGKTTEGEIIAYIGAMASNSVEMRTFADAVFAEIKKTQAAGYTGTVINEDMTSSTGKFVNAHQGYWMIEESTKPSNINDYSLVMVTSMGIRDINISTKRDNVTNEKEVYHEDAESWDIVGDNQIGDKVHFHTKSLVPDADGFNEMYVYVLHDKMSDGLTSNVVTGNTNNDVVVYINSSQSSAPVVPGSYYHVYDNTYTGDIVLGTYTDEHGVSQTAKLNCAEGCTFHIVFDIRAMLAAAVVDDDDVLHINYSAILNKNAVVYPAGKEDNKARLEYSNNPYDEDGTHKTPWDEVFEYSFQLNAKKVDETTQQVITGAKFVLSKRGDLKIADILPDKNDITTLVTTDLVELIKSGDNYTIKPDGVTGSDLTYVIDAGTPVIKGLNDSSDYYLYEIIAPDGYNAKEAPVRLKIFAQYNADGTLKTGFPKVQVDSEAQSESMEVIIENSTGTILPSTGGVGTTMFYVIGATMVLAAIVLLITKKRMAS